MAFLVCQTLSSVGALNRLECTALAVRLDQLGRSTDMGRRKEGLPSKRNSVANLASQMSVAFFRMDSNTGSRSPGEREMTLQHLRGRGLLLQRFARAR